MLRLSVRPRPSAQRCPSCRLRSRVPAAVGVEVAVRWSCSISTPSTLYVSDQWLKETLSLSLPLLSAVCAPDAAVAVVIAGALHAWGLGCIGSVEPPLDDLPRSWVCRSSAPALLLKRIFGPSFLLLAKVAPPPRFPLAISALMAYRLHSAVFFAASAAATVEPHRVPVARPLPSFQNPTFSALLPLLLRLQPPRNQRRNSRSRSYT